MYDISNTEGVIYAVYNVCNNKLYIGQTMFSAFKRWKEHFGQARRIACGVGRAQENDLVNREIGRLGWRNFRIFVLEKIPAQYSNKNEFFELARPRELWWIFHLHTYQPKFGSRGLNGAVL